VETVSIEATVDLRQPHVQEWFFGCFGSGDAFHLVSPHRRVRTFVEMLPTLMDPQHGGNDTTKAIGVWLSQNGGNALVYPSARSNAATWWEDGALASWYGFCLLDLRDTAGRLPADEIVFIADPWDLSERAGFDLRLVLGGPHNGSWWVQGPQQHLEAMIKSATPSRSTDREA
jgi:hypothetical protein